MSYTPADRRRRELARTKAKHAECTRCGELVDECVCRSRDPLSIFDRSAPSRTVVIVPGHGEDDDR